MKADFEPFSIQHFSVLIIFALFTLLIIWFGLNSNILMKKWIGFGISLVASAIMVFDSIYRLVTHTFDVLADLPFFLCDVVVLVLPFAIWTENRKWLGIFYFWALAGTLQALITPELEDGFPGFNFFRYFIMHAGIVTAVIYFIVVWKIKISWQDFWNAILFAQLYIIGIHIINIVLRSNYSYTMRKPESATILDFMGAWPWYLLFGELVMIILFLLLMLPFAGKRRILAERSKIAPGVEP